jgi:lysophospholipase L1-like esterase
LASAALSGLSTGTTYSFRVAATNGSGTTRGSVLSFTPGAAPTATTLPATSVGAAGATLNGNVTPNGLATTVWFEYGTDPSLAARATTASQDVGSGFAALPFSVSVSGLDSNETYYFRAVASNAGGTQKGAIRDFPTEEVEFYVAVGDSITFGQGDDISADDTSLDGRNTGGGFEPILNDLLTAAKSIPHNIANEGVGGVDSAYGAANISTTLSNYPEAKYYLILYGSNDADTFFGGPVSREDYKSNMQTILSAIFAAGKTPYLAKVPSTSNSRYSDASIQEYNAVIDELVAENGITASPPDFYGYFLGNPGELIDGLHPNGTGYQSMANLWRDALSAP